MTDGPDIEGRERLTRLEEQVKTLSEDLKDAKKTLTQIYDLMNQAKGAKWAILGVASLAGLLGSKAGTFLLSFMSK